MEQKKKRISFPPGKKRPPAEKKQCLRTTLLFLLGGALSYGALLCGILRLRQAAEDWQAALLPLGLLLFCAVLNPLLARLRGRQIARIRYEQGDGAFLATHSNAAQVAEDKLRRLKGLRLGSLLYAAALLLIALAGSFFLGGLHRIETMLWLWWPFCFFAGAATARIPLVPALEGKLPAGLERDAFPRLWRLCESAAGAVGCRDRLHLCVRGGTDVAVFGRGKDCVVNLGMDALLLLPEEELYQLLLGAFAPSVQMEQRRAKRYAHWLQNGRDSHALAPLCSPIFCLLDMEYDFQRRVFDYAAAFCTGEKEDALMRALGEPRVAASALLRLRYFELWSWETDSREWSSREDYAKLLRFLRDERPAAFREELPERQSVWDSLIEKELLSETWRGQTLRERIRGLGLERAELLPYTVTSAYRDELLLAAEKVDDEAARKRYENGQAIARKTVDDWEAEGCPLKPQSHGDVINALRLLGRIREALSLCDRAIDELPDSASIAYPCYYKGSKLLHDWDARGLNLVYRAMEENGNYIEEGLQTLADYCRLSGDREALRQYEERAPEFVRRHEEEDSEIVVLRPTDDLRGETLPEALKRDILSEISAINRGEIRRIFLVRKTITPTSFTSAMVVQLEADTPPERRDEIMRRIFNLLDDSTNWQFSLFSFEELPDIPLEQIEGSVFYEKESEPPAAS